MPRKEKEARVTDAELDALLRPDFWRESSVFDEMVSPAEQRLAEYQRSWDEMDVETRETFGDALIDEAAPAEYFATNVCEIALVAMWHWVERYSKRRLAEVMRDAGQAESAAKVTRFDFDEVERQFVALHLRPSELPRWSAMAALRRFANSWKHEPDEPNEKLRTELGLAASAHLRGHLPDSDVLAAMATRVGLGAGAKAGAVVREFADAARDYLLALYEASAPTD